MTDDTDLRAVAVGRLKEKTDFWQHLLMYVLTNLALIVIWAFTWRGFFWPIIPIVGWGIAVVWHALSVYVVTSHPSEQQIEAEVRRLRGPGVKPS